MSEPLQHTAIELLRARLDVLKRAVEDTEAILDQYLLTQAALKESEERFRLLVAGVKDYAIFMLDIDGTILSWNLGAQRIKGYRPDEIIGKNFAIFYLPEEQHSQKPANELVVAARDGQYQEEGWRVRKDGSLFWANVLITAVFDEAGDLRGFAKVTRDMTERKRADDERERLHQSELELERSREAQRQRDLMLQLREHFLTTAAHELRTPITSLVGYAELLERRLQHSELGDNERIQRPVHAIIEQANRLNRMTTTFLDHARLGTGSLVLQRVPTDLVRFVVEIVEQFRTLAEWHNVQLVLPAEPVLIEGDDLRLEQVLYNLLQNAMKYSPPQSIIRIEVWRDECANIRIADQGIGIPEQELPLLFDQFYRATNASGGSGTGWGIGLHIVKELVTAHGGTVDVTSVVGAGTTFTLRFPLLPSS